MDKETKMGLLVGLTFIILFGMILKNQKKENNLSAKDNPNAAGILAPLSPNVQTFNATTQPVTTQPAESPAPQF